ncbi:ribonuclease H-like domain-containing protein [Mycena sp. CBHHK59/15]|nr:ribonuclease H-like domain-containing protein [Mycena sp. CBHHK59/15]
MSLIRTYAQTLADADIGLETIANETLLGLDLEWPRNAGKDKIRLIQIASTNSAVVLDMDYLPELPARLVKLLEDETVLKAGVGIEGDTWKLWLHSGVNVKACVDLSKLARSLDARLHPGGYSKYERLYYKADLALAKLVKVELGREISKEKQSGTWTGNLEEEELDYAAMDAVAGALLLHKMLGDFDWWAYRAMPGTLCVASVACHEFDDVELLAQMTNLEKSMDKIQYYERRSTPAFRTQITAIPWHAFTFDMHDSKPRKTAFDKDEETTRLGPDADARWAPEDDLYEVLRGECPIRRYFVLWDKAQRKKEKEKKKKKEKRMMLSLAEC